MQKHFCLVLVLLLFVGVLAVPLQTRAQNPNPDPNNCIYDEAPELLGGARPASQVLQEVELLSNPRLTSDARPLVIETLPVNAYVIVFDLDEQTKSWFRVIWPCDGATFTGWVPAETIGRNTRRVNPKSAPPPCAIPIETMDSLSDIWTSTVSGDIALVADVYRYQGGTLYAESFFYVTRNGREMRDKERRFTSSGPFLINGEVIGLEVQQGQAVGVSILPAPREDLIFFGTIYQVPEGCEFGNE